MGPAPAAAPRQQLQQRKLGSQLLRQQVEGPHTKVHRLLHWSRRQHKWLHTPPRAAASCPPRCRVLPRPAEQAAQQQAMGRLAAWQHDHPRETRTCPLLPFLGGCTMPSQHQRWTGCASGCWRAASRLWALTSRQGGGAFGVFDRHRGRPRQQRRTSTAACIDTHLEAALWLTAEGACSCLPTCSGG